MGKAVRFSFMSLVYLFLYLPIIVLIANSFNDNKFGIKWGGFSDQVVSRSGGERQPDASGLALTECCGLFGDSSDNYRQPDSSCPVPLPIQR